MRNRRIYNGKEMMMQPCNYNTLHQYFSIKHFRNSSTDRMVREYVEKSGGGGGGVALSVVPLLQERFRRLQRMKELREGKELLRTLSESERCAPTKRELMSESYSHELVFLNYPPKPQCQLSLSLCPDSPAALKRADSPGIREAPPPKSLMFSDAHLACSLPIKLDVNSASDIDTSLRL